MSEKKVLEMKGITKIYPGVRALDGVDFIVEEGSVHGVHIVSGSFTDGFVTNYSHLLYFQ